MSSPEPTRRFRLRFSLRQLFLAVALVAVVLGVWKWLTRKEVVVRAATAEDEISASYAGFIGDDWEARNIAVVSGKFAKNTSLSLTMFAVRFGTVEKIGAASIRRKQSQAAGGGDTGRGGAASIGRKQSQAVGSIWESLNIRLAFGERDSPRGREAVLGASGQGQFVGNRMRIEHNINIVAKKTLPGTITPGRPHIVYVEGDQKIVVDGSMSVEKFAKANPGNYIVVTVEVR
ncbi:MAG TPA: hypothetical protein VND64_05015 [Pirellulales bacterium]|nr:hypothetical protein [Pirellulales bacterium]